MQCEGLRDVREGVADCIDHFVGAGVLNDFAVDAGLYSQAVAQVADFGSQEPSVLVGRIGHRSFRVSTAR